ncbi:MAG: cytochrome, partial [Solirubrobacterales bacterium]|nr:cytochrome [Solirubrobacterales bacterium]
MPKLKLPAPPPPPGVPRRQPKRPDAPKQKPLEVAAEAGASVVDWVDERTSLSGGARWMMFRKVPKGT